MSKIISIVNQKGGTGKTTTAINLSAALAEYGKKVLLIDLDPQGNATSGLGIKVISKEKGVYEVLCNKINASCAIKRTYIRNFDILPSTQSLAGATVEFVNLESREFLLQRALTHVTKKYNYIFIDCPPSLGILTINGLVACQDVLVPVQCEYYALEGLSQLLSTINLVWKNLQPDLYVLGVVLTMHHRRIRLSREVVSEIKKHFPYRVFNTIIPRNISLAEAPSFGRSILQYAPKSPGAEAYRNLAKEILNFE